MTYALAREKKSEIYTQLTIEYDGHDKTCVSTLRVIRLIAVFIIHL